MPVRVKFDLKVTPLCWKFGENIPWKYNRRWKQNVRHYMCMHAPLEKLLLFFFLPWKIIKIHMTLTLLEITFKHIKGNTWGTKWKLLRYPMVENLYKLLWRWKVFTEPIIQVVDKKWKHLGKWWTPSNGFHASVAHVLIKQIISQHA